jgi:hypothetical protein
MQRNAPDALHFGRRRQNAKDGQMDHDVHDVLPLQVASDLPPQPAEACTELEFSEPMGGLAVEPAGRMERYLAAMRRWLGTNGISTES